MIKKRNYKRYKPYKIGTKVMAKFHIFVGAKQQQVEMEGVIVEFNDDLAQIKLTNPLNMGTPQEVSIVMTAMDNCTIIETTE